MLRAPSRRKKKHPTSTPNLIPILDAVFIFIFFLLMSANFIKIFEIGSNVPIISNTPPPPNKKPPLGLTLRILSDSINLRKGAPARTFRTFKKENDEYPLEELHQALVSLKQDHSHEKTIVFEPLVDITYEELVKIMDAVRSLGNTDPAIFIKDKNGIDTKEVNLFSDIIFGNIRS